MAKTADLIDRIIDVVGDRIAESEAKSAAAVTAATAPVTADVASLKDAVSALQADVVLAAENEVTHGDTVRAALAAHGERLKYLDDQRLTMADRLDAAESGETARIDEIAASVDALGTTIQAHAEAAAGIRALVTRAIDLVEVSKASIDAMESGAAGFADAIASQKEAISALAVEVGHQIERSKTEFASEIGAAGVTMSEHVAREIDGVLAAVKAVETDVIGALASERASFAGRLDEQKAMHSDLVAQTTVALDEAAKRIDHVQDFVQDHIDAARVAATEKIDAVARQIDEITAGLTARMSDVEEGGRAIVAAAITEATEKLNAAWDLHSREMAVGLEERFVEMRLSVKDGRAGADGAKGEPGPAGVDGKSFVDYGVHQNNVPYPSGAVVTYKDSMWIAQRDNPGEIPGPGWRLAVSKGKDGKPGPRGEAGPRGTSIEALIWEDKGLVIELSDGTVLTAPMPSWLLAMKEGSGF